MAEAEGIYSLDWTGLIKPLGRVFVYNNVLWLSFSGTGISFECEGGFTIGLVADEMQKSEAAESHYARYAVLKDGEVIVDARLDEPHRTVTVMGCGLHTYTFIKLSESADSSIGIDAFTGEGEIRPAADKALGIEFVGDSITCGYGVEGHLGETYTTATENMMKAWAYLVADRLEADFRLVSKSGSGIISGYTGNGEIDTDNLLPPYYDRMGCSVCGLTPEASPSGFDYDFSFSPNLILINFGVNDISYCRPVDEKGQVRISQEDENERRKAFYICYKQFVSHIRERNPFSRIVCMLGATGQELNGEISLAVRELQAEGDTRISFLALERLAPEQVSGTDWHPNEEGQRAIAKAVIDYVQNILQ